MKIFVKVKPNSKEQKIIQLGGSDFLVFLRSEAEKNKANIELVKLLSSYFNVSEKRIKIKNGLTSKNKIIEVKDEI
ncbi:MAG: DUF167 family protein [Candidatus Pacearchaeota archaeon]